MMKRPMAILAILSSASAHAATIHVNTTADQISDTGSCSLREAIIAANTNAPSGATNGECPSGNSGSPDSIVIPAGVYALTRTGGDNTAVGGDLDILQSLNLIGAGRDVTIIEGGAIGERVLHVLNPANAVSASKLTLRNGTSTGSGGGVAVFADGGFTLSDVRLNSNAAEYGGGLYAAATTSVTLTRVRIDDNIATWEGGGVFFGGTALTIADSDILGNQNSGSQAYGAGIYLYYGVASLSRVTVADNIQSGGGYDGGGIYVGGAALTLSDSTVENNLAADSGGGIYFSSSSLASSISNSTIANNSAGETGGALATATWGSDPLTFTQVTIASNSAPSGSALDVLSLTARNSILSGTCSDASVTSLGGNIESPGDNCGLTHATDQIAVSAGNLGLSALNFYGGRTRTTMPSASSVALDTARTTYCTPRDQRGANRPQGAGCDVGAVERVPGAIFYDGYESGSLGAWSSHVP